MENKNLRMELMRRGYPITYVSQRLGLRAYQFSLFLNGLRIMPDPIKKSVSEFLKVPRDVLFDPSEQKYFEYLVKN